MAPSSATATIQQVQQALSELEHLRSQSILESREKALAAHRAQTQLSQMRPSDQVSPTVQTLQTVPLAAPTVQTVRPTAPGAAAFTPTTVQTVQAVQTVPSTVQTNAQATTPSTIRTPAGALHQTEHHPFSGLPLSGIIPGLQSLSGSAPLQMPLPTAPARSPVARVVATQVKPETPSTSTMQQPHQPTTSTVRFSLQFD